jgi:hypothetical protein
MFTKRPSKIIFWFFSCALLSNISIATDAPKTSAGRRPCVQAEKDFLTLLGLREDANDTEIIQLLDIPEKQIFATALVSYRKTYSAVPKLLQIVNDSNTLLPAKIAAADTLCYLGNKEWMAVIKPLSLDPNGFIARTPLKIKVAGLLARAGDYSQFEIVAAAVSDRREYVRFSGIWELANFRHKTEPVTDLAVELLVSVATTNPDLRLREQAILSLEKIAKIKTEVTSKVINVVEANLDSSDEMFRLVCRAKLKKYGIRTKKD